MIKEYLKTELGYQREVKWGRMKMDEVEIISSGMSHTRKDGEFRGGQDHAHLVDVMVEVGPRSIRAIGRFGDGQIVQT